MTDNSYFQRSNDKSTTFNVDLIDNGDGTFSQAVATKPGQVVSNSVVLNISETNATGSGAINTSHALSVAGYLNKVTLKLSAAPTTSENLTITLDSGFGAAYDVLLYSRDLSSDSITDLVWMPDSKLALSASDAIVVAYANTDTKTFGLVITTEE